MAEFVVSFVLERLQGLASEEASLLHGVSSQVEQLRVEFQRMQCFLKDADARESESKTIHNWVVEIKEIAYDSEDIIETYVIRVASRSMQSFLKRCVCILNEGKALHKVGSEIQSIKTRISQLTTSLQTYGIRAITEGEGSSSSAYGRQQRVLRRSYSHVVEKDFVGLEEDVEELVGLLVSEDKENYYRTLSICGMGGLGKTTIAQKVYNDQNVKRHFDGFAWVCVSQQWQTKDILQGILTKLIPHERDRIVFMREEDFVRMLVQVHQSRKCLVVLDDIWSEAAWDCIRHAFPTGGDMGGKILITTRNQEVALHVDPHVYLHEPRLLTEDESWELLQKKAFTKPDGAEPRDDKNMEDLGREMVKHCGGLPLAVIVLGGILVTKQTLRDWEMVHRNISSYIRKGKGMRQQHGVSQVLALSYSDLPYQLKSCFLYLGNFPEDSEIEADKLYPLWIAEGLVSLDDQAEGETMMDVAERCLVELAYRYMVQVEVDEFSGRFKSCSLHDLMRDLCLLKGKEQNFLMVVDFRHGSEKLVDYSSYYSSLDSKVRRLAIHLGEDGFPKIRTAQHLRSLSFFVPSKYICIPMPKNFHFKGFKVLRVLDLGGIQFSKKLARAVGKLIHLRYLSLRNSGFRKLPSSIGNLGFLQTLDLRLHEQLGVSGTIPNVLWKMKSLRHLYLNDLVKTKEILRLDGLSKLELLETFTTHLFDLKDLFMLTNLWKLNARVQVEVLEDLVAIINYLNIRANRLQHSSFYIGYNFCSEEEVNLLRQLLECRRLNALHIGGVIGKLPEHHHFSPNLTMLEFSRSELKEDPMATLEKLPNLRRLALGSNAFVGVKMVCSKLGFPQLKFLKLKELSNLEEWMVDEGSMPNLSSLEIGCERLKMVPDGLRFISTLQELKISISSEDFQRRLRVVHGEEGADLYKVQHVPSIIFNPYHSSTSISMEEVFRLIYGGRRSITSSQHA
ncbi:putative disease resistance protein At1g50180 [Cornus florida]|uniref:putative disease resistance protein At1g50180 n=1 Tax=Cornus florida TaxID=4283 RepID=UPI00289DF4DA|nr:putative disease resistance protein At1g50180 [Cornus florida]